MKTLRTIPLVVLLMMVVNLGWGQTTVFSDDFTTGPSEAVVKYGPIGTSPWSVRAINGWSARRNTAAGVSTLDISNSAAWNTAGAAGGGWALAVVPLSGFKSPYNVKLSSNPGVIAWTFNMRTHRSTAGNGFGSSTGGTAITEWYANALVLASTDNTEATGDGYAVVEHRPIEGPDAQAPTTNNIALVKFTGGIRGTRTILVPFGPALASTRNFTSNKVTYNPKTNEWQLFSRDDGGYTTVMDPESGTLPQIGTVVKDSEHTLKTMTHMFAYAQGSYTSGRYYQFANIKVTVSPTTGISNSSEIPKELALDQNYPNPFNPTTNIRFSVPVSGRYSLRVFNLLGQEIAELLNKELHAGTHAVGCDGSGIPSGIYIYTLTGANAHLSKAMMLVK
jgi:hypothetical protein